MASRPRRPDVGVEEIFGVSATAAVYRREALRAVASGGEVFDPRLGSYYEDVDLAGRLRAAGFARSARPGGPRPPCRLARPGGR